MFIKTISARAGAHALAIVLGTSVMAFSAPAALALDDPKGPTAVKNPKPAKGPLAGRPEQPGAQALAPVRGPPLPTKADKLPLSRIKVPAGFKVEVFASGINNARTLRVGDKGTVFVGNWRGNKVWAVTSKGGKQTAKVLYPKLDWPNGLAFHKGTLYIAEHAKISKAENIEANLDKPPKLVTIYDKLGKKRPHG